MSARDSGEFTELEGEEDYDGESFVIENIGPSLTPKARITVPAMITKYIVKLTLMVMGIVLVAGFIHAIQYPRTRTEWEYQSPVLRRREGVPVVYERITSLVPCTPKDLTERWVAYNEYKAISLEGNKKPKDWGKPPDCSLTEILWEQASVCWVMEPKDECSPHITWQDLHEQRDEAFQRSEGAEVQRVYPSDPAGEISTDIKIAKGDRQTYSCTTVTARNRYIGDEEWGQWEEISNCSLVRVNGTKAIELRTTRRELAPIELEATHKVTLLTKWPTSLKRELQAFFDSVTPEIDNSSVSRTLRATPAYQAPPASDRAGGCPHKTMEKWFPWTVGIAKPGKKIKPYPPGLQWIKSERLAGQRTLYFVDTPVLSPDQVEKIEGTWGTQVLNALLDCIAEKLDPLDLPWRDLTEDGVIKRSVRHSGEMIPICREPVNLGCGRSGTVGQNASCRLNFREHLRRFRVTPRDPYWLWDAGNGRRVKTWTPAEEARWKTRPRTQWKNYAGLGLTHYEVQLLESCWTKPGVTEEDKLRMFLHQQMAAQILGFQLWVGRIFPPAKYAPTPLPGSTVFTIGENNKNPPDEANPDPNKNFFGGDRPIRDWVMDWKEREPQQPLTAYDFKKYLDGEVSLPPPLILSKKTKNGYILRWGMEPTFQATGARLGAYPNTTYGIRGKRYCTPEDQTYCTKVESHPDTHVDEATSAMVDLASTRTLTHATEGSGQNVVWINWGSLTREQASGIGCDAKKMVARYYTSRNPPPQEHAWNNMHWYDTPVVRDKTDRWRWIAINGDQGSWFYNAAYPQEVGGPTALLNCYRASPSSPLGTLQESLTYKERTGKCGHMYSMSARWIEKGFPYVWPPEAYLMNRWSFANTRYCNNKGDGNCACHNTCGQKGWMSSVMMTEFCKAGSTYDFGTPWPPPSEYLINGRSLSPGIGWTARVFTLQAVFPKNHAVNMTEGGCTKVRAPRKDHVTNSAWTGLKLFNIALTTVVGKAGEDIGEAIKNDAITVYETTTSVIQTSWTIIKGILKWAIPCMILIGVAVCISILYRLGLLGGLGRCLKATGRWICGWESSSQKEGPRPQGRV